MAHKTPNGTWRVQWRENRRMMSKVFPAGTLKSVIDKFEAEIRLGFVNATQEKQCPTFADYAARWIEHYAEIHKAPSTVLKDRQILRDHLNPTFGAKKLFEIRRKDIRDLKTLLCNERGFAAQTVNNILGLAHKIFEGAVSEDELIQANPVSGVKRVPSPRRAFKFWTFEEKDRFLSYCRSEDRDVFQIVALATETGLRPMEIKGLKRDCLDFENGEVMVRRNWCTKTNKLNEYTKTKRDRKVPMSPALFQILADKRFLAADAFVFQGISNAFGALKLQPMAIKAKVTPLRFHDLRHTFASHLAMRGVPMIKIMDLLGHTKMDSTLIYAHLSPSSLRGVTDVLSGGASWTRTLPGEVVPLAKRESISAAVI
jgi:integrase